MRGALTQDLEHFIEAGGLSRCVFTGLMLTVVQKSLWPPVPCTLTHFSLPGLHTSLGQAPQWPALSGPYPPFPKAFLVEPRV